MARTSVFFYPYVGVKEEFYSVDQVTENENGSVSFLNEKGDSVTLQGVYKIIYFDDVNI